MAINCTAAERGRFFFQVSAGPGPLSYIQRQDIGDYSISYTRNLKFCQFVGADSFCSVSASADSQTVGVKL